MTVVGLIMVLFVVFLCSDFRSPLSSCLVSSQCVYVFHHDVSQLLWTPLGTQNTFVIGAASDLRVRFRTSKTGLTLVMLNKLMPRPLLISSQSDYLIRGFDRNSHI